MKKQTSPFLLILAVTTGATLLLGAVTGPTNTGTASGPASNPDPTVAETKESTPPVPSVAPPAKSSGLQKAEPSARLSFGVDEVVKMYQGGVEADVILNYVENSSVPYHLSAEEIVRLHDLGVPSPIVTALIRHGAKVQQQATAAYAQSQQKAAEEAKAAPAYVNTYSAPVYTAPPPVVTYNYTYPEYAYTSYPVYAYSGCYSYPRYCYSGPFYYRYSGYPFRHSYYSYRGCVSYPHFGFGATFGHSPRFRVGVRF